MEKLIKDICSHEKRTVVAYKVGHVEKETDETEHFLSQSEDVRLP